MVPTLRTNGWLGAAVAPTLGRFRDDFEDAFDRIMEGSAAQTKAWSGAATTIWEDQDRLFIQFELPGLAREDVEVTVHNGVLTVKGERKSPVPEGAKRIYNSRTFGAFEQAIKLSNALDPATVKAGFENGVLKIEFGKAEAAKPRKIEIQSS